MRKKPKIIVDNKGQAWDAVNTLDPTPLDLSPAQIAAILGRRGGKSKSAAKSAAARANGAKGGRPKRRPHAG